MISWRIWKKWWKRRLSMTEEDLLEGLWKLFVILSVIAIGLGIFRIIQAASE